MSHRANSPTDRSITMSRSDWGRAATLSERAAALSELSADPPSARAHARLSAWRAQGPFDEEAWFAQRLASDDLTVEDFTRMLEADFRAPVPAGWATRIEDAFAEAPLLAQAEPELGFLTLVAPLLQRARAELGDRLRHMFTDAAALRGDPKRS